MRPLFAIAPLALALALLGPSQATTSISSWSQELLDWVFDQHQASGPAQAGTAQTQAQFGAASTDH